MKQQIFVENIKCGGCINSIQTALLKIPAVENVAIVIESNSITIEGNPDIATVIKKLNDMGYPETGDNTLLKKAKSYVSCAIGNLSKNEHRF